MGAAVSDVMVRTRFVDVPTLMAAIGSSIERGCLRVRAQIDTDRTFQISLVTSVGLTAVRGAAEVVSHEGESTWVRFLSADNDQTDGGIRFDLTDADVTVPPELRGNGAKPAKAAAGPTDLRRIEERAKRDWIEAMGTEPPAPGASPPNGKGTPPEPIARATVIEAPPAPSDDAMANPTAPTSEARAKARDTLANLMGRAPTPSLTQTLAKEGTVTPGAVMTPARTAKEPLAAKAPLATKAPAKEPAAPVAAKEPDRPATSKHKSSRAVTPPPVHATALGAPLGVGHGKQIGKLPPLPPGATKAGTQSLPILPPPGEKKAAEAVPVDDMSDTSSGVPIMLPATVTQQLPAPLKKPAVPASVPAIEEHAATQPPVELKPADVKPKKLLKRTMPAPVMPPADQLLPLEERTEETPIPTAPKAIMEPAMPREALRMPEPEQPMVVVGPSPEGQSAPHALEAAPLPPPPMTEPPAPEQPPMPAMQPAMQPPMMQQPTGPVAYYVAPMPPAQGWGNEPNAPRTRAPTMPGAAAWGTEPTGSGMWIPVQVDSTGMHQIPMIAQGPPAKNRAMLVAVAIASAGAAVAISAVMWARSINSTPPAAAANPNAGSACVIDPATGSAKPPLAVLPGTPGAPPSATPATNVAPAPTPAPAVAPDVPAAALDPGAEPEDEPPPAPVAVTEDPLAGGPCRVAVTANATAAEIWVGGKLRAVTPATIGVPCEPTVVTLRRNRYEDYSKKIRPTERGVKLDANMDRPNAILKIVSTPSAADVTINGRLRGKTPLVQRVEAYEKVVIVVRAPDGSVDRRSLRPKPGTNVLAARPKKK